MFDLVLPTYDFFPGYIHKLVADVPEERLCEQPLPGVAMNHAAWTLGHLAFVNDMVATMLGKTSGVPANWKELFGKDSKPQAERAAYASKAELLTAFESAHHLLREAAISATPEMLSAPSPERMRNRYPTMGHLAAGLMTGHYANHIGQLSAWRRAIGLPSVF